MRLDYNSVYHLAHVVVQLGVRDFTQKYRSSALGALWVLLQPLLVVGMFYFVFSVAFDNRWRNPGEPRGEFILALFSGFLVYNLFSDVVGRSPTLVSGNVNYVKKLVFPLEIMSIVPAFGAVVTAFASIMILMILHIAIRGNLPSPVWLLLPGLLLPPLLLAFGFSWALSAICAYFKDVAQVVPLFLQALVFLSPILYPSERVPPGILKSLISLNPLGPPIEAVRAIILDNTAPQLTVYLSSVVFALIFCLGGLTLFRRVKPGFADVI